MTREEAINKIKQMSLPKETMEILEALAPELRESEDDRIRRVMIEHFKSKTKETWCGLPVANIISYLEKQKEQDWNKKPCLTCQEYEKGHKQGYTEGCTAGYNKAMKEMEQKEEEGYEAIPIESTLEYKAGKHAGFLEGLNEGRKQKESLHILEMCKENTDSFVDGIIEVRSFQRGLEEGKRQEREKQEEQKPWKVGENAYFTTEQKPAEKQDYSGLNDLERAIHRGFLAAGVENVPVEIIKETAQECLAQMRPAEWSKEDEEMRKRAICACNFTIEKIMSKDHYGKARDWLKSLPIGFITNPNYNSNMIELLASELQAIANNNGAPRLYDAEISWLRSLRPSWKPSEEQMDSLRDTIIQTKGYSYSVYLPELYEQLKKMI